MRAVGAAIAFFFTLISHASSKEDRWFLCLNNPAFVHFFHETNTAECRRQIRVTSVAYLIGGVNVGLAATVSDAGEIVEDGYHFVYLPRGTAVLVLDASLNGRNVVYIWNTHTFVLMSSFFSSDHKKSFAWQSFDDRFDSGQYAITIRKAEFILPRPLSGEDSQLRFPAEIPSGRVVRVYQVVQDENLEMREIEYAKVSGYVDARNLRPIEVPRLDADKKYYVGRTIVLDRSIKQCGISESISTLTERSDEWGIKGTVSGDRIAELAIGYGKKTKSNENLKQEVSADIRIVIGTVGAFSEPSDVFDFVRFFIFGQRQEAKRIDFNFVKISTCDGSRTHYIVSQGLREVTIDGPVLVQNEDDFDGYRVLFINGGFSSDEAFFALALISRTPRPPR